MRPTKRALTKGRSASGNSKSPLKPVSTVARHRHSHSQQSPTPSLAGVEVLPNPEKEERRVNSQSFQMKHDVLGRISKPDSAAGGVNADRLASATAQIVFNLVVRPNLIRSRGGSFCPRCFGCAHRFTAVWQHCELSQIPSAPQFNPERPSLIPSASPSPPQFPTAPKNQTAPIPLASSNSPLFRWSL